MTEEREFGAVAFIDTATRGVIGWFEVFLTRSDARTVMAREPALADAGLLSWGHVTVAEVRRLVDAEELTAAERVDALETLDELLARASGGVTLISFHFRRTR